MTKDRQRAKDRVRDRHKNGIGERDCEPKMQVERQAAKTDRQVIQKQTRKQANASKKIP